MKINLKKTITYSFLIAALILNLGSMQAFASHNGHCCNYHQHHCKMKAKMDKMFEKIGVNPCQKQKIDSIFEASKATAEPILKCKMEKKKALMQYLTSPQATKEQAMAMEQEITCIHEKLAEIHINTMFEIRQILTPEQLQKMAKYHQEHMDEFFKHHAKKCSCNN